MCEYCDEAVYLSAEEADEIADDCVAAGIEWLDNNDNVPSDWRERLNLGLLNIDDSTECVLGQLFKDRANNPLYTRKAYDYYPVPYSNGYDYAVYELFGGEFSDSVTGAVGFSSYQGVSADRMTAAWVRALS